MAWGAKSKCSQRQEVEAAVSKGLSLGTSTLSFHHIVFIKAVTEHLGSRRTRYPTSPGEDVKETVAIFNLPKYYHYYYYSTRIYYSSKVRNLRREPWYQDPPIAPAEGASPWKSASFFIGGGAGGRSWLLPSPLWLVGWTMMGKFLAERVSPRTYPLSPSASSCPQLQSHFLPTVPRVGGSYLPHPLLPGQWQGSLMASESAESLCDSMSHPLPVPTPKKRTFSFFLYIFF